MYTKIIKDEESTNNRYRVQFSFDDVRWYELRNVASVKEAENQEFWMKDAFEKSKL